MSKRTTLGEQDWTASFRVALQSEKSTPCFETTSSLIWSTTGREIRFCFLATYFMGFSLLKDRRTKFSRPFCLSRARDVSSEFILALKDCAARHEADSRPCSRIESKFAA